MLSRSVEDYLSVIYRIQTGDQKPVTSAVADRLGVSPASATAMFKRLAQEGLVTYREYAGARLTDKGEMAALAIIRRHRVIERFLTDLLAFPWEEVDALAHQMEHALPEQVIGRIEELLADPRTCPHGFPIPDPDGNLEDVSVTPLSGLLAGQGGVVARVEERDPRVLEYLRKLEIGLGARIDILDRPEGDDTLSILVDKKASHVVGDRIAQAIGISAPREGGA